MRNTRSPEETREILDEHQTKSLPRRFVRRLLGRYPEHHEVEGLRWSELSPAAKVHENVVWAMVAKSKVEGGTPFAHPLNKSESSMFAGDREHKKDIKSTLVVPSDFNPRVQASIDVLSAYSQIESEGNVVGASFLLPNFKWYMASKGKNSYNGPYRQDSLGVAFYGEDDSVVGFREFRTEDINSLDSEIQEALIDLSKGISQFSNREYLMHKDTY